MLETYKNYKNLFEKIKKSSKKLYYQNKIEKCKNNIKTTWKTMKEIIGKSKVFHQYLPNNLRIHKTSITDTKIISDKFNEFFINIGCVTPLMHIFSLSLSTGIFPDKLKIAKASPIFKNVDKDLLTNYHPISLLP